MSDVFISYSRKDQNFIRNLNESLINMNLTTWVDWQGISKGTKWWKEIEIGIEGTDVFVFVISPDSVVSKPCQDEIKHAIEYNKRILPLVYKEADNFWEEENSAHKVLREIDWIWFRETDDFETSFEKLLAAQKLDIEYVHQHTSLGLRASDWEKQGKKDDYLLRGSNLETAEKWRTEGNDKD